MKMKEFGPPGGARPWRPFRSATALHQRLPPDISLVLLPRFLIDADYNKKKLETVTTKSTLAYRPVCFFANSIRKNNKKEFLKIRKYYYMFHPDLTFLLKLKNSHHSRKTVRRRNQMFRNR